MFRRIAKSGRLRAFCNAFLLCLTVASFMVLTPVTSGVEPPKRVLLVSLNKTSIPDLSTQHPAILTPLDDVLPACARFCNAAHAQSTTTLKGRVVDPNGAVVPGAKIIVSNRETGVERAVQSDGAGNYQVAALPAGDYRVEVQAGGFRTAIIERLSVEVARVVVKVGLSN